MGNHLRELVEAAELGLIHCTPGIYEDAELAQQAMNELFAWAKNAMCFDLGEEYGKTPMRLPPIETIRLPFDFCWVESTYPAASLVNGLLFSRGPDGWIYAWQWQRRADKWLCIDGWVCDCHDGVSVGLTALARTKGLSDEEVASVRSGVLVSLAALGALNCSNIVTRRHDPDPKLQKARAKRGKQPLFSYHTLEIDPTASREAGVDMGGTHASPRVHLRRGHIRQFAPGRYCWVRESVVRGTTPGIVHKDYAVRPALH